MKRKGIFGMEGIIGIGKGRGKSIASRLGPPPLIPSP